MEESTWFARNRAEPLFRKSPDRTLHSLKLASFVIPRMIHRVSRRVGRVL